MATALITKPALEPVTLSEAKSRLRVESTDEDALISELIEVARGYLETVAGIQLITQTWRQYEDTWPLSNCLNLKVRPVQMISSLTVFAEDGTPTVISPADYQLDNVSTPPRFYLDGDLSAGQALNGIEIEIVAGYGNIGIDVPDALKHAILLLVAHWFEFRGAVTPREQPVSIPPGFNSLIAPYKRVNL